MPAPMSTRQMVTDVIGTKGDDTVFDYVVSIVDDNEFEFGQDGEEAFETFGAVLVSMTLLFLLTPLRVTSVVNTVDCLERHGLGRLC